MSPAPRAGRRALGCLRVAALVMGAAIAAGPAPGHAAPETRVLPAEPVTPGISWAGERMLRDRLAAGLPLPPDAVRRWGLDLPEVEPSLSRPLPGVMRSRAPLLTATGGLAEDVLANDRSNDASCLGCGNRPLAQSATSIAILGDHMVAGWNDSRGICSGGSFQGYAWSSDGGATWIDPGDMPLADTGARFRGDPVHVVDRLTGVFYIVGLCDGGSLGTGLALLRGHFSLGAFEVDDVRQIAVGSPDVLNKEWMDIDPNPGDPAHPRLYVVYARFVGTSAAQIELIVSQDGGQTWSAPQVLDEIETHGRVQGARPVVGPDGELHVVWYESGVPARMRIVRSDDHGATFGPAHTVCEFFENATSGAPGFRRGRATTYPGIAVDRSTGPHRGRVYVTWDESVDFYDAPFPASPTTVVEAETNGFFLNATPFTVGDRLTGHFSNAPDVDHFRFSGVQGQTFVLRYDTPPPVALNSRIVCAADTGGIASFRYLAFNQSFGPQLCFTLPATGTYYLRFSNASVVPGGYALLTTWDTPTPGERARDHRDRFVAWSDDGTYWSKPVRLNDDPPWFDGEYPEVTVDGVGDVHVLWHDFRDDAGCGAVSYEYLASSGDGGVTWGPNRRVSDVASFWSFEVCGASNQGDYQGIASEGQRIVPCWADARAGDPDVYVESDRFTSARHCPPPATATPGGQAVLSFTLTNTGNVPANLTWSVEDDGGWLASAIPGPTGGVSLAPGAHQGVSATFHLPEGCSSVPNRVRFISRDTDIPGRSDTCVSKILCAG
ncbi:MAG TPA: sialidase family protein, partial [Candidatus Eisenbacteria bacterium]|nr:sialidase family protein [Candidatus Eisenbacteria bacterium]